MAEKDKQKNGGMLELLLKAVGAFGSVATGNGLPAPDDIKIVGTKDLPEGTLVGSQKTPKVDADTTRREIAVSK